MSLLKMKDIEEAAYEYMRGTFFGHPMRGIVEEVSHSGPRIEAAFWKIVDAEVAKQNKIYDVSTQTYVDAGE
jgi:hypothetical protein